MIDDLPDIYSPGLPITVSPSPVPTGERLGQKMRRYCISEKNTGGRL